MLLDNPLEDRRIAARVPRALGIDDRNRSAFADAQAVRFRAEDAALLGEPELPKAPLQELPRGEAALLVAALRRRLIAAEKDVAARDGHADGLRGRALRIGRHLRLRHRTLPRSTRGRARPAAPCSRRSPMRRRPRGWR